ncbi:MAG: CAP domain-containing protein [Saccharospirillum sp.]|nr:CAP domain-containing protein [Saccharospirillum sp.]
MVKEREIRTGPGQPGLWRLAVVTLLSALLMVLAGCRMDVMDDTNTSNAVRYAPTPLLLDQPSAFSITDHSPLRGATVQALNREVMISFDAPLLAATVTNSSVRLWQDRQLVAANLVYVNDTRTVRLVPRQPLLPNRQYRVEITSRLLAETGDPFAGAEWVFTTAGKIGATRQSTIDLCGSEEALAMLDAINQARLNGRQCGVHAMPAVAPLAYQCQLAEVAESHADDMARYQVLSHLSSDGMSLADRYQTFGIAWQRLAENIAATSTDSMSSVMSKWLGSEPHCKTLLDPELTHFGMGRTQGGNFQFWVQNFASGVQEVD